MWRSQARPLPFADGRRGNPLLNKVEPQCEKEFVKLFITESQSTSISFIILLTCCIVLLLILPIFFMSR
jgi:hypothetical protein